MIFVDTSAIYAWADSADRNHSVALRRLEAILEQEEELLTHNYVLVESMALLQARLGMAAAVKFARDARSFVLDWVDEDLHSRAVRELEISKKRQISLVDHISFLVMRRHHVTAAFAFDSDFAAAGFRLLSD